MKKVKAPRLGKLILPSLNREQVSELLDKVDNVRDKAIIALFTESGLRLSELASIKPQDIDWEIGTVKIIEKGRKEALAPFGRKTELYLGAWLSEYQPNGNIWGLNKWGIISMLRRLESCTGLPCNPHTFFVKPSEATFNRRPGFLPAGSFAEYFIVLCPRLMMPVPGIFLIKTARG